AGLGAGITSADVSGETRALIGNYAVIGSVGTPVGAVTVDAQRTLTIAPGALGSFAVAISGGLGLGGAAGVGLVKVAGPVGAAVGDNATIAASGDVLVRARSNTTVSISLDGAAIGAIAVGAMIANVSVQGAVSATVGQSANIRGRNITVSANGTTSTTA